MSLYTYSSEGEKISQGNIAVSKYFSEILDKSYKGHLVGPIKKLGNNDIIVPQQVLSKAEAVELGIKKESQIYGAVIDKLLSLKSIIHIPIPNVSYIPSNFPNKFSRYLRKEKLVLPGYTVFNSVDFKKAFRLLRKEGYIVRGKNPLAAGGLGQKIINDEFQIKLLIKEIGPSNLKKYGYILEANVVSESKKYKPPKALSGAWIFLDQKEYSYVGNQIIKNIEGAPDLYIGTILKMVEGGPHKLKHSMKDGLDIDISKFLIKIKKGMNIFPKFWGTRFNFDFIYGKIENKNLKPTLYLTEQSFSQGGATLAEYIGKKFLDKGENSICSYSMISQGYAKTKIKKNFSFKGIDDLGRFEFYGGIKN